MSHKPQRERKETIREKQKALIDLELNYHRLNSAMRLEAFKLVEREKPEGVC